jgi:hypothetical protein
MKAETAVNHQALSMARVLRNKEQQGQVDHGGVRTGHREMAEQIFGEIKEQEVDFPERGTCQARGLQEREWLWVGSCRRPGSWKREVETLSGIDPEAPGGI